MEDTETADQATSTTGEASSPKQLRRRERCVLWMLACVIRLWGRTLRFHIKAEEQALLGELKPAVWIVWHNRLFPVTEFFRRFTPERKASAIISASNDGAWLAGLFEQLEIRPIRGSRHGRSMQAFREMVKASRAGYDVGVTPDGSRGPMYDMKAGAATLALRTGAPIMLMSYNFSRAWRLMSWDRFYLPVPFSRVEIRLGRIEDGRALAGGDVQAAAVILKERMDAITEDEE
jgi:lysophospholipid acyltransferase (LPLAT)-like uncharacterized protein